jgi:hypothetical protein
LVRTFKLSKDPKFVEKLEDIIGLYLHPPEHALVFSVDEKSQIQALDRTQPGLPLKKGRCGTMNHDYKRHGTTTLFAALNTLDGTVIGTFRRSRHCAGLGSHPLLAYRTSLLVHPLRGTPRTIAGVSRKRIVTRSGSDS